MRHEVWEDVRIKQHNQSYNRSQRDRMPHDEAEDLTFVSHLIRRCRGHANRLRVDHLSHHASRTIGSAHQYGIEA